MKRDEEVVLELYAKPTDLRKKKLKLHTEKQLYMHLFVTFIRPWEESDGVLVPIDVHLLGPVLVYAWKETNLRVAHFRIQKHCIFLGRVCVREKNAHSETDVLVAFKRVSCKNGSWLSFY